MADKNEGIGYRMKRPEERKHENDKMLVPLNPERQRRFEREIFRLVKEQEGEIPMNDLNIEKRKEARALLDNMDTEYKTFAKMGRGVERTPKVKAKFNSMTNQLFDMLTEYFHPTNVPAFVTQDDIIVEIHHMLRNSESICMDESAWMGCYNPTFAVMIIRSGLKDYRLPMVQASGWKSFAKNYTALVMAA